MQRSPCVTGLDMLLPSFFCLFTAPFLFHRNTHAELLTEGSITTPQSKSAAAAANKETLSFSGFQRGKPTKPRVRRVGDTRLEMGPIYKEGIRSFNRTATRYPNGYPVLSESILPLGNSMVLLKRVGRV